MHICYQKQSNSYPKTIKFNLLSINIPNSKEPKQPTKPTTTHQVLSFPSSTNRKPTNNRSLIHHKTKAQDQLRDSQQQQQHAENETHHHQKTRLFFSYLLLRLNTERGRKAGLHGPQTGGADRRVKLGLLHHPMTTITRHRLESDQTAKAERGMIGIGRKEKVGDETQSQGRDEEDDDRMIAFPQANSQQRR